MAEPTPYEAMRLFAEGLLEELEDEHSCTEVALYRQTLADIEMEADDRSTLASAWRALEETYDLPDNGIVDWSVTLWHDPDGWHVTTWRTDTGEERADGRTPIGAIRQLADPARMREHAPQVAPTSVGGGDG